MSPSDLHYVRLPARGGRRRAILLVAGAGVLPVEQRLDFTWALSSADNPPPAVVDTPPLHGGRITGCAFAADGRTMFLNVVPAGTEATYTVAVRRVDGRIVRF